MQKHLTLSQMVLAISAIVLVLVTRVDSGMLIAAETGSNTARFEAVAGWGKLSWDMRPPEVRNILDTIGISHKVEGMRVYFSNPKLLGRLHSNDLYIRMTLGDRKGSVHFDDEKMLQVRWENEKPLSHEQADKRVKEIIRQYGPPQETRTEDLSKFLVWKNKMTILTVTVAETFSSRYMDFGWSVVEHYEPAIRTSDLLWERPDSALVVEFSPDGRLLASGGFDNAIKLWDAETLKEIFVLKGHASSVFSVAFSRDGRRLTSRSFDGTVKIWDVATGREVLTTPYPEFALTVALSSDGKWLASASNRNSKGITVWDATTGKEVISLPGHSGLVSSLAFSPDGKRLVSGGTDKQIKIWDLGIGRELMSLSCTATVHSLAFSPDGKRLASGTFGGAAIVSVWDATTGKELLVLKGHRRMVDSVAFSQDGKRLATGGYDEWVKVWDATTGEEQLTLKWHTGGSHRAVFSPDSKRLAIPGYRHSVKVWDLPNRQ